MMDGISAAANSFAIPSIAIQLADSVKKLYDFWNSVRDAPDEIRAFGKDIKLLSTVLDKIELEEQRYGSGSETLDVLESCKEQVASLMTIVRNIAPGFEADSRRKRTWSTLKAAFKKEKIIQFRDCLRETKITLLLARNSINHVVGSELYAQQRTLKALTQDMAYLRSHQASQLQETTQTVKTLSILERDLNDHTIEVLAEIRRMASRIPNPVYRHGVEIGMNKALREAMSLNPGAIETQVTSLTSHSTPGSGQISKRSCSRFETNTTSNIFGTFDIISRTDIFHYAEISNDDVLQDEDQYEYTTTIRVHPSWWLIRIGFGYHLNIAINRSSQGPQYSLNTSFAVPDGSPIFDFCRSGDINSVQSLFSNREATPWDTDSLGRTPLHFAAETHNPKLCRLLLNAGASRTAMARDEACIGISYRYSPLRAAAVHHGHDFQDHIDTIRLFMEQMDFSDEDGPGWLNLFTLLDANRHGLLSTFIWALRTLSSDIIHNASTDEIATLASFAMSECSSDPEVFSSILNLGKPVVECLNSSTERPVFHYIVLCDLLSSDTWITQMESLISRGGDPHTIRSLSQDFDYGRLDTPTSLAMRSSNTFYTWKTFLEKSSVNIDGFVKREIEIGHLTKDGWRVDTLRSLFGHQFQPFKPQGDCRLCSAINFFKGVTIETAWQKKLKEIQGAENPDCLSGMDGSFSWREEFDFLCPFCWEVGPVSEGSIITEVSSESGDSSSDSDSPFLLPI